MNRAIVVGAGQLGSRHLQGLAKAKTPMAIDVVDPSSESLRIASERFSEIDQSVSTANFMQSIPAGVEYDLAIISCSSNVRMEVLRTLFQRSFSRFVVLEKFLFSRMEEYAEAAELFTRKQVKAWVNCARRLMDDYEQLRKYFCCPINISVRGDAWGLACNSIHMIDLAAWFSGESDFVFDANTLHPVVHPASRKGFIEFTGLLTGSSGSTQISLYSGAKSGCPKLIHIMAEGRQALLDERNASATLWEEKSGWKPQFYPLRVQLVSNMTNVLADELHKGGDCRLPTFADSAKLSLAVLKEFTRYYRKITNSSEAVSIT